MKHREYTTYCSRIFDKDDDGFLTVEELRKVINSMGDRMTDKEVKAMVKEVDPNKDGYINYRGIS